MDVPTSLSFTGWKHARLVATTLPTTEGQELIGMRFKALQSGLSYGPDAAAACIFDTPAVRHSPPNEPQCGCGFYALASRSEILSGSYAGADPLPNQVVLQVGFYGTVIEGTFGFRASHQRVLECQVSALCSRCRRRPASLFAVILPSSEPEIFEDVPVVSVCEGCVPSVHVVTPAAVVSPAVVERLLGVSVRFDVSVPPPIRQVSPTGDVPAVSPRAWWRRLASRLRA